MLGGSSGAIVALELLPRRPDCVRIAVAHEPPCSGCYPAEAPYSTLRIPVTTVLETRPR